MTPVTETEEFGLIVVPVRGKRQECAKRKCRRKGRLVIALPLADIGDDGGPGLAAIPCCSTHIEEIFMDCWNAQNSQEAK